MLAAALVLLMQLLLTQGSLHSTVKLACGFVREHNFMFAKWIRVVHKRRKVI